MRSLQPLMVALVLGACGGTPTAPAAAPTPVSAPKKPSEAAPPHSGPVLARSAVRAVLSQGLGSFLRRIDIEDRPVLVAGRFHGFRVAALRDPAFWSGVDLMQGDVVTSVNGFPIERPEQAQAAFNSLDVASELRVAYERDGHPRELVYPIVDDR